jgi:gas vesicle protein
MANTRDKVADAAGTVKPYVERAMRDEELRDNVKSAFQTARDVYDELIGQRGMTTVAARVATDKDIQDRLRDAVDELREAADRIQGKKDHSGRNATLLIAGIALGILFNPITGPSTRKWLSDVVFGGDDDFTYASSGSTTPSSSGNSSTSV